KGSWFMAPGVTVTARSNLAWMRITALPTYTPAWVWYAFRPLIRYAEGSWASCVTVTTLPSSLIGAPLRVRVRLAAVNVPGLAGCDRWTVRALTGSPGPTGLCAGGSTWSTAGPAVPSV